MKFFFLIGLSFTALAETPWEKVLAPKTFEEKACHLDRKITSPLQENSHRLMKRENGPNAKGSSRSHETGNYLIRRLEGSHYQAILNVDFISSDVQLKQRMKERTRSCLKDLRPYLKGPADESLEILLLSPEELKKAPSDFPHIPVTSIHVSQQEEGYRGNAANFGSNFTCQTIAHEIFHHLGLVDEYRETNHLREAFNCRVVTAKPSYMRNISHAFDTTIGQDIRCHCDEKCQKIMKAPKSVQSIFTSMGSFDIIKSENSLENLCTTKFIGHSIDLPHPDKALIDLGSSGLTYNFEERIVQSTPISPYYLIGRYAISCTCPKKNVEECPRLMKQISKSIRQNNVIGRCPFYETKFVSETIQPPSKDPSSIELKGNQLLLRIRNGKKSLLSPNHFRKIIEGTCSNKSEGYSVCAQYNQVPKVIDGKPNPLCDPPKECFNDDFYLGK